jgi:hypothetical protein
MMTETVADPWKINLPLSDYATKILKMYVKFPEDQPFTALDWKAVDGTFLDTMTKGHYQRYLYGVSDDKYHCQDMREKGFHKVSQAHYRSEAKITNDAFSFMVINPSIDDRLIDDVFNSVDPYNMPNFEQEIRNKVMREEEERERLKQDISDQIDFGSLDENNEEKAKELVEETEEEKQERVQKKMRLELEKRIKTWRMAMKEQQKNMFSMRHDHFLLQRATNYIRPGGILMFITPKEFIDDNIAFKLVNQYEDIKIVRLDDDEYEQHRKCIIFAKKRQRATREDHELGKFIARTKEKPYKTFGDIREVNVPIDDEQYEAQLLRQKVDAMYEVLEPQVEPSYIVPVSDAEDIPLFRVGAITGTEAMLTLRKSKLIQSYREKYSQVFTNQNPVTPTPLHKGHIMLLLTSGFLNGYIGTGPDQHLVKGSAIKDVREFTETDDEGNNRIVEREFYNIGVKLLNAQGQFRKIM